MSDEVTVGLFEAYPKVRVKADIRNAPVTQIEYRDVRIGPDQVVLTFEYKGQSLGWQCSYAEAMGYRSLKPSKDGWARFGVTRHTASWRALHLVDLADPTRDPYAGPVPEWLRKVVNDLRPSGEVTIPRA